MNWNPGKTKSQKQTLEEKLVSELHRIRDNLIEESRAQFDSVKTADARLRAALDGIASHVDAMKARIDELERKVEHLERR